MAHKLRPAYYRKLRQLLDDSGKSYCLYLSTALHEETSFDGHFTDAFRELKRIFGDKVYFLGYLSDAAVFNYLSQTTYFAAFFEKGVRANNTSVHSAMQFGSVVITNLSEHSPAAFTHMGNMIDIQQCDGLPTSADMLRRISSEAERTSTEVFGWKHLVECLSERKATI
jgi:hypothetical protein